MRRHPDPQRERDEEHAGHGKNLRPVIPPSVLRTMQGRTNAIQGETSRLGASPARAFWPVAIILGALKDAPHFDLASLGANERAMLEALPPGDRETVERALPFTMSGVLSLIALIDAVRHCVRHEVPWPFAECGVWLGGSVM